MDWIKGIQRAIDYTEAHLTGEIDYDAGINLLSISGLTSFRGNRRNWTGGSSFYAPKKYHIW